MQFTEQFDRFVCVGDTITTEIYGYTVVAEIQFDDQTHIDDCDSHNTDQSIRGCDDEQQKQLLAAREAWFNDEWFYCGVVLSISSKKTTFSGCQQSLWGIGCNYPGTTNEYLTEVANELLPQAREAVRDVLRQLFPRV